MKFLWLPLWIDGESGTALQKDGCHTVGRVGPHFSFDQPSFAVNAV